MELFLYVLFEKYIHILALEMASPGSQHCARCIGALSVPVRRRLSAFKTHDMQINDVLELVADKPLRPTTNSKPRFLSHKQFAVRNRK